VQINDDDDDDDDETVIDVGVPFSDSLKLSDAAANPAAFSNVWSAPPWKAYSGAVLPQQTLLYLRAARKRVTRLVTHLVWPHQPENPPGRRRARWIGPRRSPSLFPLFYSTVL